MLETVAYLCALAGFVVLLFAFLVAFLDWKLRSGLQQEAFIAPKADSASSSSRELGDGSLQQAGSSALPADYVKAIAELTEKQVSQSVAALIVAFLLFAVAASLAAVQRLA